MQDNGKNTSISFQNVPFFPTRQLLKSKHHCKTLRSTKKKKRYYNKMAKFDQWQQKKKYGKKFKRFKFCAKPDYCTKNILILLQNYSFLYLKNFTIL